MKTNTSISEVLISDDLSPMDFEGVEIDEDAIDLDNLRNIDIRDDEVPRLRSQVRWLAFSVAFLSFMMFLVIGRQNGWW